MNTNVSKSKAWTYPASVLPVSVGFDRLTTTSGPTPAVTQRWDLVEKFAIGSEQEPSFFNDNVFGLVATMHPLIEVDDPLSSRFYATSGSGTSGLDRKQDPGAVAVQMAAASGGHLVDTDDDNYDLLAVTQYQLAHAPQANSLALVKTVVLSAMFAIAFIGNTATLIRMFRMRRRRSTINLLITHLAAADLIVTFFCNVTDAIWTSTVQWFAGDAACRIIKFLQVFGLYLSTYVVVIISIDRCWAILDPIRRNGGPRRVKIMIVVAWVASALFSLPQLYIFRVMKGPFIEEFYQCVTFGAYTSAWQEQLYSCLSVTLLYVLPLVTMVTAYMLIFATIARKSRDFQNNDCNDVELFTRGATVRRQLFYKAKVKSLRMTALIVAAFIICWTPYQVLFIVHTFTDTTNVDYRYFMWIFFFGMANSMVNPLIYGACTICRRNRPATNNRPVVERRRAISPRPSSQSSSTSKVIRYYLRKKMHSSE